MFLQGDKRVFNSLGEIDNSIFPQNLQVKVKVSHNIVIHIVLLSRYAMQIILVIFEMDEAGKISTIITMYYSNFPLIFSCLSVCCAFLL